jgi:hypothetical protein
MMEESFPGYATRCRAFIERSRSLPVDGRPTGAATEEFNALALTLFQLQFTHNPAYLRLCEARRIAPHRVSSWREIPAVPTTAFKELELTSLAPEERTAVFLSSGTTAEKRSRHFHNAESLAVYEASLLAWFERHLLAESEADETPASDDLGFLALTPSPDAAPNSSLAHMFGTVQRAFGTRDSLFVGRVDADGDWTLDMDATLFAIRKSMCANRPLLLLGTAFNYVHLLDHFAKHNMRYRLAAGSRVLETGGYKGRTRELPKSELHALITRHLGIPPEFIVTEYGMSELSSQAYDQVADCAVPDAARSGRHERNLRFPPWARAVVVSPETGQEVPEGETGLLRIFDLANVHSVMAIQTEDLAVRRDDGFELIGRAARAESRGCSLMSAPSA